MFEIQRVRWPVGFICWTVFVLYTITESSAGPSAGNGPSGSTFTTALTWSNYQLAAFADLNADRQMDTILVDPSGQKLYASVAPPRKSVFSFTQPEASLPEPTLLLDAGLTHPIRAVSPADFNGDSVVDLLLLTSSSTAGPFDAYIAYGASGVDRGTFAKPIQLATFSAQPMVCDMNSDLIADIYGELSDNKRVLFYGGKNLTRQEQVYDGPKWSQLGYSAFGDVNDDSLPDVLVLVNQNDQLKIQLMLRTQQSVSQFPDASSATLIDLPQELLGSSSLTLGLFVLTDFDADGKVDLLLPACTTGDCRDGSVIFTYSFASSAWSPIDVNWTPSGISSDSTHSWSLALTPKLASDHGLSMSAIVGPTVGDFDLDGKPDVGIALNYFLTSATDKPVGSLPAVLLNQGISPSTGHLALSAYLLPGSQLPEKTFKVRQIAFFDLGDRGSLDVFTSSLNEQDAPSVQLFLQHMVNDFYFIKVTILNGLCPSADQCTDDRLPYGLPVPGLSSAYRTESASGGHVQSTGLLGVQSCCAALQVPFSVYGLGAFANYVEQVSVAIPPNRTGVRSLTIPAVVPNSELFVNPYPHDDPARWKPKLFLQPLYNMKVVYIAITLLCVCVVLIIIIAVLQWLEFREDRSEKEKEAQRFHFDAM